MIGFLLYGFIAMIAESVHMVDFFDGVWGFFLDNLAPYAGPAALTCAVVSALAVGVLLLLRLSRDLRTWSPFLQGLSAAGITTAGVSLVLTVVSRVADTLGS